MRVTVWRREGLICQLRPRKSIWWSALRRRPECRARWRSTRVGSGQAWSTQRCSWWALAQAWSGEKPVVRQTGIELESIAIWQNRRRFSAQDAAHHESGRRDHPARRQDGLDCFPGRTDLDQDPWLDNAFGEPAHIVGQPVEYVAPLLLRPIDFDTQRAGIRLRRC